ncbi:hypothetical protein L596_014497 [Steinernema carpocapsae]|uniref:Uncharacterized protein n=1 Tax=Steinernema carpocapsae TaxID=34508 RepID=A0A4U5ND06_STECR|nr:hypothetical protein L596_014497 [Steinernema carpocapsae]
MSRGAGCNKNVALKQLRSVISYCAFPRLSFSTKIRFSTLSYQSCSASAKINVFAKCLSRTASKSTITQTNNLSPFWNSLETPSSHVPFQLLFAFCQTRFSISAALRIDVWKRRRRLQLKNLSQLSPTANIKFSDLP